MLKKISLILLCTLSILSVNTHAATHMLRPNMSVDYELEPNKPQEFINFTFWTIKATCVVQTEDDEDDLFAKMLAKGGTINDIPLRKGQSMHVALHNNDIFKISAESGAKVSVINNGLHTVKATCST